VNTARHLKSGKAIHTAKWEVQKLSEMGQLTAENARIIRDALRQMPKDMKDALDDTAKESLRLVDEAIEEAIRTGVIERSPISSTQGVIDELSQQALDQMNLVNTTMLESSQKAYLKCVNDTVRWETSMLSEAQEKAALETLNDATTAVLSGGETRTLALRRAIKELNAAGLYGFVDKRGRHWSPEAYVNMCMRTTVHNVAVRSVQARQQDYGSSIFQCSYHPASRPEHYPFQNKFYSWDGTSGTFTDGMGGKHQYESVTVTGYGTAAGLFGINCGHFPLPQIPGVTVPSDPDMQSAETDARQYKESQEQRQLERNIRLSKRLEEAYKAAGDDVGATEAGMRTRLEQARMREFIDRTGRVRRYDREQISGYGPDKLVRPKQVNEAKRKEGDPKNGNQKTEDRTGDI
jgi:polyhydroxyalkanoate synthesis regulator phasin